MEVEDDIDYSPPHKQDFEAVVKCITPSLGSDFLNFDTDGFSFISDSIIPPILTHIKFLPYLEANHTLEIIGKYGSGKSTLAYSIISNVVASTQVGGMEMEVVLFDLDFKLELSTLLQCILAKFMNIQDEQYRLQLYKESVNRVIVYRPKDMCEFSLILSSLLINKTRKPRLFVVESLSSYLYDLGLNEFYQSLFRAIITKLKKMMHDYKASVILISPRVLNNSSSFYYMPIPGWYSFVSHRLLLKKIVQSEDPSSVLYRIMSVEDNSLTCDFRITESGLSFI